MDDAAVESPTSSIYVLLLPLELLTRCGRPLRKCTQLEDNALEEAKEILFLRSATRRFLCMELGWFGIVFLR